jgi:carboxypeptidase Taq
MEQAKKDYSRLHQLSHHAKVLEGISHALDWDQETFMPPDGAGIRAEQLKTLAGLIHKEKTGKKFSNALSKLIDLTSGKVIAKGLNDKQKAALHEWRRDYRHAVSLPTKFVEEFAQLSSQTISVWRLSKEENTFHRFAPFLEKIVSMNRRKADLLGYKDHPYDALLDEYEPGSTTKDVQALFSDLSRSLTALLKKIQGATQVQDAFLHGSFDHDKQIAFSKDLLRAMGYDFNKGRLDFSSHPFSSATHPTDSRITTRINTDSVINNICTVLHEGGHSLYEMGLPIEEYGTPLGEARSLGVHESQSRWWETRIGLTKPFWKHFLPLLKSTFKGQLDHITLDQFYKGINKVKPSLIRVEADEVTYPLHVILRFELEKDLIAGTLSIRDLPDAWNAKMKSSLGITPKSNQEGCMQDVHWSMGAFGYFPTYTLGNIYAAHLFNAFENDHPDWENRVAGGELNFIREWLHDKVYQHGRRYSSHDLLKLATGQELTSKAYTAYLTNKYSEIYRLK